MSISTHDEELLKRLTISLVTNPRANTQVLAKSAGISRATFNRFCGSRENLMDMIEKQSEKSVNEIIALAQKNFDDYNVAISSLVQVHFTNQEYLIFSCTAQNSLSNSYWENYLNAIDTFFLNGQKNGAFRIDIPNSMMSELFVSMICGMIDAESRGRVASLGIENQITKFFINGISNK
jgi:TetR/AcrR family transcriptional repressor of mexCD-oprJ operon